MAMSSLFYKFKGVSQNEKRRAHVIPPPPCFSVNKHTKLKYLLTILFIATLIFAGCPSPSGSGGAGNEMGTFTITIGDASRKALTWDTSVDSNDLTHYITLSGGSGGPHTAVIQPGGETASFTVAVGTWTISVQGKLPNGDLKSVGSATVTIKSGERKPVNIKMGDPGTTPTDPPVGPTDPTDPTNPPTIPSGAIEFDNVATIADWDYAVNTIKGTSNNANGIYAIYLTGSFSVSGTTTATFGTTPAGSTLEVYIVGDRQISLDSTGALLYIGGNQTVITHDVKLKGFSTNVGACVVVVPNGILTMQGYASVSGNTSSSNSSAGGVNANGTFTMKDNASVSGNIGGDGGGVNVRGTLTMQGNASVSGNTSDGGGGVYVDDGILTMQSNATVSGNSARLGGGVFVRTGSFRIESGTVTGSAGYKGLAANTVVIVAGLYSYGDALYVYTSSIPIGTATYGTGTGTDLSTVGLPAFAGYCINNTITGTGIQP
jgi:hypothetical protein